MPEEQKRNPSRVDAIADSLWDTVLWPQIRRTALDLINRGASMLLREPYRDTSTYRDQNSGRTPYRQYYDDRRSIDGPRDDNGRRDLDNFDDIVFPDRGRAERVLEDMAELCYYDKVVSVYKFIDIARQRDASIKRNVPYTYWDYGWTDIDDVYARDIGNGYYILTLPPAKYIGNRR